MRDKDPASVTEPHLQSLLIPPAAFRDIVSAVHASKEGFCPCCRKWNGHAAEINIAWGRASVIHQSMFGTCPAGSD